MISPTNWSFKRPTMMPIVKVSGVSQSILIKNVLIHQAVEFIEKSIEFDGKVLTEKPEEIASITEGVIVQFSIIFPNENSITGFLSWLSNR